MSIAWLILLFPLAGSVIIALGWRLWAGRLAGAIGTVAIFSAFIVSINVLLKLQDRDEKDRQVVLVAWNYAKTAGVDACGDVIT